MDGTGKTTSAKWVYDELAKEGKKVAYFNVLAGDSVLRRLLGRLTRQVREKTHKDPYNPSKGGILRFWPLFSLADAYLTHLWLKLLLLKKTIIIDRYFYDEIAIMACLDLIETRSALRIVKLMPRPDVVFLFETGAETAYGRKPEHPLEFFMRQAEFYRSIAPVISAITIDTERLDRSQASQVIANELEARR